MHPCAEPEFVSVSAGCTVRGSGFVRFHWFVRKSEIIWFDMRVLCFCILGCEKTRGDGKCVLSFLREATEQLLRD